MSKQIKDLLLLIIVYIKHIESFFFCYYYYRGIKYAKNVLNLR